MPNSGFHKFSISVLILLAFAAPALRADSAKRVFELVGTIIPSERDMLRAFPTVSLHSVNTSFSTRTLADLNGKFKFKHLTPGMYTLTVAVPQVRVLRKTIDIGPSFADAQGKIFLNIPFERQTQTRRRLTVSAVQLAIPDDARKEYGKAQEFLEKGDTERATASLKKAVEIAPQFSGAWNMLGTIAYKAEQIDEAERYFREALNHNPSSFGALVNLGGVLISQGKLKGGLEVFLRAVDLRPDDPMAQARVGLNYLQLGDLDKAEQHLKEAKKLEPGHFSLPQLLLAEIYARRGNRAAAIVELEEFLKIHPDTEIVSSVRKTLEHLRSP